MQVTAMSMPPVLNVRPAAPADAPLIWRFVRLLAQYEHLEHRMQASEADLAQPLFGPSPRLFADLVELEGEPVGFAVWFYSFSTFAGRAGLYVEDLFVLPEARGCGAGKALLANLARRCLAEGLYRLEWAVLDWNAPAIGFYDRIGAETLDDWTIRRLSGPQLAKLAQ